LSVGDAYTNCVFNNDTYTNRYSNPNRNTFSDSKWNIFKYRVKNTYIYSNRYTFYYNFCVHNNHYVTNPIKDIYYFIDCFTYYDIYTKSHEYTMWMPKWIYVSFWKRVV
jgi:hypothetical protein